jgi:outer membrane protein OmpA-like peptidoglycan-associated protein
LKTYSLVAAGIALGVSAFAQSDAPPVADTSGKVPVFRVSVTSRSVKAINYRHRSGATKVNFKGTDLMPAAKGEAKVESKRGAIEIEVEFGDLQKPTSFGSEYLTYVLWAISPEGRASNLGEVLVGDNHKSKLDVTSDLQAFAMIVTAEPYYAVTKPSNVVIMENEVRSDTLGSVEAVNAKYDLTERGGYIPTGYKFDPVILNTKLPLEFFEARNALRIAQSEGAERYAPDSYARATKLMDQADSYAITGHVQKKPLIGVAREAVQTAEDARAITVRKIEEARAAAERQAAADSLAAEQASKAQAEADALRAQAQKAEAERDAEKARADAATAQAASASALSAAQAEAEKSRLAAQQAEMSAQQAQATAQQAEADKQAMREKLSAQLNSILQTRDSARGLIVSMSDVLFDTGKYSLKPGAREKLAKVAGILLAYPGLNIAVGGYTDNVGSDAMNQTLSEHRAGAVRDYLVAQGVGASSVTATGFGNSAPVASNENSAGRQQNRRVELLVSGDAIGKSTMQ